MISHGSNASNTPESRTDGPRARARHYEIPRRRPHQFQPGEHVYSKRCGRIDGFDGIIVEPRGAGFQVLDPKTGKTYQRDHYDLIAIDETMLIRLTHTGTRC